MWSRSVFIIGLIAVSLLVPGCAKPDSVTAPAQATLALPPAVQTPAAASPLPAQPAEAPVSTEPIQPPAAAPQAQNQVRPPAQAQAQTPQPQAPARDPYVYGAPALDPIDPLMPDPTALPSQWQSLDKAVRTIAGAYPGRVSVEAVDLTSGLRYEFRPGDRYYPASTFKLPVTICIVQAIDRGELSWDTMVTFTKEDDDTAGQGGFATAPYGSKWSVRNLLDRSIISSNNVAVKMLARALTWDGLTDCTAKLGGMVTRTEEGSTPVSARDEAAWWLAVWQMNQEKPKLAANLLTPLRQVTYRGRIQAGTPRPDLVTHKFGTYPPYENDGAIIWGDHPYILVVLTYGGSHAAADTAIARIAEAAWAAMQK